MFNRISSLFKTTEIKEGETTKVEMVEEGENSKFNTDENGKNDKVHSPRNEQQEDVTSDEQVSLWCLSKGKWVEIESQGYISITTDGFQVEIDGEEESDTEENSEKDIYVFTKNNIASFRQHKPDMLQWSVKEFSSDVEAGDYGLVFSSEGRQIDEIKNHMEVLMRSYRAEKDEKDEKEEPYMGNKNHNRYKKEAKNNNNTYSKNEQYIETKDDRTQKDVYNESLKSDTQKDSKSTREENQHDQNNHIKNNQNTETNSHYKEAKNYQTNEKPQHKEIRNDHTTTTNRLPEKPPSKTCQPSASLWKKDTLNESWVPKYEDAMFVIGDKFFGFTNTKTPTQFFFDNVSNFRRHRADMCQWTYITEDDRQEEYGSQFSDTQVCKDVFVSIQKGLYRLGSYNEVMSTCDAPCKLLQYNAEDKVWLQIGTSTYIQIITRTISKETALTIDCQNSDSCNSDWIGCRISRGSYIFPNEKEGQVVWWGMVNSCCNYSDGKDKQMIAYAIQGISDCRGDSNNSSNNSTFNHTFSLLCQTIDILLENIAPKECKQILDQIQQNGDHNDNNGNDANTDSINTVDESSDVDNKGKDESIEQPSIPSSYQYRRNPALDGLLGYYDSPKNDDRNCSSDSECDIEEIEEDTSQDMIDYHPPEVFRGRESVLMHPSGKTITRNHRSMEVANERAFVLRGASHPTYDTDDNLATQMQVLNLNDSSESVVATIDGSKFKYKGNVLDPVQMLLHQSSKMVMNDRNNREKLYLMDIEHSEVVQSWNTDSAPVDKLLEVRSGSSLQDEATFLGLNKGSIFVLDSRDNQSTRKQTIQYKTKVDFVSAGTTESGKICVGSKNGDIRLFDGTANKEGNLKRAKTQLNGLGEPIISLCTTKDGDWILGTCAPYLVLLHVKPSECTRNGFEVGLGKKRPKPIILQIDPLDIYTYHIANSFFTRAEFNSTEQSIVSSIAHLLVIWNFKAIKKGHYETKYTIKPTTEFINEVAFLKNDAANAIIAATPNTVSARLVTRNH